MSTEYRAISWNPQKKLYDLVLVGFLSTYLLSFIGIGALRNPTATAETLLIRAFGTAAFLLLHVVLCIGPLARLDRRFLPLLYNRRHLGVTTFLLGLGHGGFELLHKTALSKCARLMVSPRSAPRLSLSQENAWQSSVMTERCLRFRTFASIRTVPLGKAGSLTAA